MGAIVIEGDLSENLKVNSNTLSNRRQSFIVFEDDESAETAAADYWRDMARTDQDEFLALVGADTVIDMWMRGQSFEDWCEQAEADEVFGRGETSLDVTDMLDYLQKEYPELSDWLEGLRGMDYDNISDEDIQAEVEDEDDEAEEDEDKARCAELLKEWQEVLDDLGYTPTIAYKN